MKSISENRKEMLKWVNSGNTITDYFLKTRLGIDDDTIRYYLFFTLQASSERTLGKSLTKKKVIKMMFKRSGMIVPQKPSYRAFGAILNHFLMPQVLVYPYKNPICGFSGGD